MAEVLLASVEDVETIHGSDVDSDQITAMLASASARFANEARRSFTPTATSGVFRPQGTRIVLPDTPIISVESVSLPSDEALDFVFDGLDTVTIHRDSILRLLDIPMPRTVKINWTYGFEETPEDVRWAVVAMVVRAIGSPDPGMASEQIGGYGWRGGGYTASGALSMTRDEIAVAHKYRRKAKTVSLA